ncbi:DUF5793 family protein [Halorubrum vacuolatum]|uniref:Uncharacterized protein n=1 Tax=Halorubrum vacuolatum TaxID=63740 RepID=A0A238VDS8_HALVU|nr:DUF5793 family protein [Halorubrum vacuolatum]SNR31843.1 hypothetical protein SAMN06264855_102232 [Halorubrum vacuolatum]
MRRDYFELSVEGVGDADPPVPLVRIDFHGPEGLLRDRLSTADGELLSAGELDVAFRLREPLSDAEDRPIAADRDTVGGVVGVTNRYTGDFILELNENATDVFAFIQAARRHGNAGDGEARYHIEVDIDGERLLNYEKETFLVYDHEGNLLREHSLIPSGVEL